MTPCRPLILDTGATTTSPIGITMTPRPTGAGKGTMASPIPTGSVPVADSRHGVWGGIVPAAGSG